MRIRHYLLCFFDELPETLNKTNSLGERTTTATTSRRWAWVCDEHQKENRSWKKEENNNNKITHQ